MHTYTHSHTGAHTFKVAAGRATTSGGSCFAVGSGDAMGLYNIFTKTYLAETSSGYYVVGQCP